MMMTMQGHELKAIRTALDMSQESFGEALGMSKKFVGMMERGDAPIERRTALAAGLLGVRKSMIADRDDLRATIASLEEDGGGTTPAHIALAREQLGRIEAALAAAERTYFSGRSEGNP